MFTLHNTLTKKKEPFEPIEKGRVGMYTCGPTVYDYAHIGNWKSYITADILRRQLVHSGYEVRHIENITDVGHLTRDDVSQGDSGEDKMEIGAKREHKTPQQIAQFYETYFKDSLAKLNILPAHFFPRATEHISNMISLIEALLEKGRAYEKNGNVFYDVASFPPYGKLSGNTLEHLKVGARLEDEHPDKKNQWDFALWLKAPKGHLMQWDSPWGRGYPGWHIECSAMSEAYLGEQFDIHTGGEDHIFPHHEAEIAQTEGATDKHPSVRFWVHTRHLLVDGKKMSKSKGNFYRLEDIEEKGYSPMHLRLALLSGHYRSQMNFTWDALDQARSNFKKIVDWEHLFLPCKGEVSSLRDGEVAPDSQENPVQKLQNFEQRFWKAMDDDLNTPKALAILYELITFCNAHPQSFADPHLSATWKRMNAVLGLVLPTPKDETLSDEVLALVNERNEARAKKDFSASDTLRTHIESLGYTVEDTPIGTAVKKK